MGRGLGQVRLPYLSLFSVPVQLVFVLEELGKDRNLNTLADVFNQNRLLMFLLTEVPASKSLRHWLALCGQMVCLGTCALCTPGERKIGDH